MTTVRILLAGVFASVLTLPAAAQGGAAVADTVFRNGKIYTVDPRDSIAQAVAVRGGRIVYVGTDRGATRLVGPATRVFDLQGRMMMPGLVDGHVHPLGGGAYLRTCSLEYRPLTEAQMLERIQACLDAEPGAEADKPLTVTGWYRQFMQPPGTDATRDTLDRLRTKRPVIVINRDGHSTLANSRALDMGGVTDATPNPEGGSITRDAKGRATGILEDAARQLVNVRLGSRADTSIDDVALAINALTQAGVTSILDAGTGEDGLSVYRQLQQSGKLTVRVHAAVMVGSYAGATPQETVANVVRVRDQFNRPTAGPDPDLRVHTAKLIMDGVIQAPAQTAGLVEPYWIKVTDEHHEQWRPGTNRGPVYIPQGTLESLMTGLAAAGIDPHVHAIGDRAVKLSLDAIAKARAVSPGDAVRPAVAHAELVEPVDYARFRALNAVPVMSYQWSIPAPNSVTGAKAYLGSTRFERMEPFDKLHSAGVRVVYGSDWPVDRLDYWLALKAGVTRAGDGAYSAQFGKRLNNAPGLDRRTALRSITLNGAWALHVERETGSIEKGKLADLIVLKRDFTTVPEDELADNQVLLTMVGGKIVHMSDDLGK